jgi:hypothetical protein
MTIYVLLVSFQQGPADCDKNILLQFELSLSMLDDEVDTETKRRDPQQTSIHPFVRTHMRKSFHGSSENCDSDSASGRWLRMRVLDQ